jgi:hypothetical protein
VEKKMIHKIIHEEEMQHEVDEESDDDPDNRAAIAALAGGAAPVVALAEGGGAEEGEAKEGGTGAAPAGGDAPPPPEGESAALVAAPPATPKKPPVKVRVRFVHDGREADTTADRLRATPWLGTLPSEAAKGQEHFELYHWLLGREEEVRKGAKKKFKAVGKLTGALLAGRDETKYEGMV